MDLGPKEIARQDRRRGTSALEVESDDEALYGAIYPGVEAEMEEWVCWYL